MRESTFQPFEVLTEKPRTKEVIKLEDKYVAGNMSDSRFSRITLPEISEKTKK